MDDRDYGGNAPIDKLFKKWFRCLKNVDFIVEDKCSSGQPKKKKIPRQRIGAGGGCTIIASAINEIVRVSKKFKLTDFEGRFFAREHGQHGLVRRLEK